MTVEVLKYLSLSLSPVIIIGVWAVILKILKNKREKTDDKS
jgi:hypothetical protein